MPVVFALRYSVCALDYVSCVDLGGGIIAPHCTPVMFNFSTPLYPSVVCQVNESMKNYGPALYRRIH